MNDIVIYQNDDNEIRIEVRLDTDTIWLTQARIAELFETSPQNITTHLRNVYTEGELDEAATCKDFLQVRKEGMRIVNRKQKHYNLDAVLSVGYRIKSIRATQFRIWANKVLKDYLLKGYALNEAKLNVAAERLNELKQSIRLIGQVTESKEVSKDEISGMLRVVADYAHALDLLDQYDHQTLTTDGLDQNVVNAVTYEEAIDQIIKWRDAQQAGPLFGNEKDQSFQSSLNAIYQSFNGQELYPSIEEKAANLLYFVVKNHSFTDGNKRIAAGLFIYFLDKNKKLYDTKKRKIIPDNALVAITVMVAESKPEEKNLMVKLIINLIKPVS